MMFRFYKGLFLLAFTFAMLMSENAAAKSIEDIIEESIKRLEPNVHVELALAANSADSVLCLNEVSGSPGSFSQDQEIIKRCFIGDRLKAMINARPGVFIADDKRKEYFFAACSNDYPCDLEDEVFGGRTTRCGHLGTYLDFIIRVKGLPNHIFAPEEGVKLCGEAIGL